MTKRPPIGASRGLKRVGFRRIFVVEEHYISGGLSSLVSQVLSTNIPTPLESVALTSYAESGKPEDLFQKYGLTSEKIFHAVKKVIDRKKSL